ncbi:hypothetical protein F4V43_18725 [Paenibacillus spiritus]|uniref:Uncharacterized protein n=1 Tax=Paenibacillus spiritus TaxID=2496557 RepID=A0A5J5FSU9_9BACL|nr:MULTISPECIES: hypothetical protein [Paenibacillus]KAA8996224.1 hypothetical protein F4V43_18725 [Paenibacillus spiritus]
MLPQEWQEEDGSLEFGSRKARIGERVRSGSALGMGNALVALLATGAVCVLLYWAADLVR